MTRLLTALVIVGALLGVLLFLPPEAFALMTAGVGILAWSEHARMAKELGAAPLALPGAVLAAATALAFALPGPRVQFAVVIGVLVAASLACLYGHYRNPAALVRSLAATVGGICWIGILLGAQIGIRYLPDGVAWLLLLYAAVAVGDSAAYYGGSTFGRSKLAADISPNKTIEGSLFGLAGSAIAAMIAANWLPSLSLPGAAVLGAGLGLSGQAGDLLESAVKRAADTKDSSNLLPGHGGVLDRIDAHLLAGAVLWVFLTVS